MSRITREQMLIEMAYIASKRGTCGRLAVGAVLARDSRPISLGYVGAPPGEPHCEEAKCDLSKACTRTRHAEHNVLRFALEHKIRTVGADLFVTDSPCLSCAEEIIDAGIARVFFDREYRLTDGLELLLSAPIEIHRILANGMIRRITSAPRS